MGLSHFWEDAGVDGGLAGVRHEGEVGGAPCLVPSTQSPLPVSRYIQKEFYFVVDGLGPLHLPPFCRESKSMCVPPDLLGREQGCGNVDYGFPLAAPPGIIKLYSNLLG